jgi:RNA polymerase sigma-B factor
VPTILGELKRYFRDLGWSVHVPRGAQEMALKVEEAQQRLTTQTGRPPSVPDLAQYLEMSIEDVLDALETASAHHSTSLDAPRDDGEDDSGTLADAFGEIDERFELVDASVTIAAAAEQLSARERRVLSLRFVHDMTQTQIADQIGVSQMQVSRILRRALTRLRELTEIDESASG